MLSKEQRDYLLDFFDWFPVEDRKAAVKSLEGFGDNAIKLYENYKEIDERVMTEIHIIYNHDKERIKFFESRSPGLRCHLWEYFRSFMIGLDLDEEW